MCHYFYNVENQNKSLLTPVVDFNNCRPPLRPPLAYRRKPLELFKLAPETPLIYSENPVRFSPDKFVHPSWNATRHQKVQQTRELEYAIDLLWAAAGDQDPRRPLDDLIQFSLALDTWSGRQRLLICPDRSSKFTISSGWQTQSGRYRN
jgi:hypothetical protein